MTGTFLGIGVAILITTVLWFIIECASNILDEEYSDDTQ